MTLARRALSVAVGVSVTLASLWLVAAVNTPPPHPPEQHAPPTHPITVAPAPHPPHTRHTAEVPDTPTHVAREIAPTPQIEPARLPKFGDQHPAHDLGPALAGLGGLGLDLGPLPAMEEPPETGQVPDTPARPLRRPPAPYPPRAQRRGIEGEVVLRLRVDRDGRVVDAVVVSADPPGVFDEAALAAARRYVYRPALLRGEALPSTVEQRVVFQLR